MRLSSSLSSLGLASVLAAGLASSSCSDSKKEPEHKFRNSSIYFVTSDNKSERLGTVDSAYGRPLSVNLSLGDNGNDFYFSLVLEDDFGKQMFFENESFKPHGGNALRLDALRAKSLVEAQINADPSRRKNVYVEYDVAKTKYSLSPWVLNLRELSVSGAEFNFITGDRN